ncbi:uncharacterized protein PFL1_04294 [Pseudozyma flocculosa PF-1]|uniref:Uncharacterized protein n=2 Tax=Pseudozyma flocculosa TaxID=84751 RepID=A0A5C3FBY7_9BASI|nr:uncharacterized protein PFL1_04294 [Pseudozyma flocculosa PF-1]EPQ27967.1 hypothetical protein PFL1_04294 [Pseudozyma flocculosa PF-1]SPO41646.1 uncharacterized protein PSFLO_07128 [Pseudozyma flocculosa]
MFEVLIGRDAAADAAAEAAAAMAAYQGAVAYAIAFIILYLTLTLSVISLIAFMGFIASPRIRRSPIFAILLVASLLCIAAAAVNISQNRDLVVKPESGIDRIRYTTLITLSMVIPFLCDFTLILRILAFYPRGSAPRWKPALIIAYPVLSKIVRMVFIVLYIHFCWQATDNAPDMNSIIYRVNQVQYAVVEWAVMLSDQLYCTIFLLYKLYGLGWGWGDEKHISGSLLSTLRTIMYSALASFAIPSFFLIALITMQVSHYRPDIEGYVFATTIHLHVACAAFACLWPAIRSDRQSKHRATTGHHHSSACNQFHSCPTCGIEVDYEVSKGGTSGMMSQHKHLTRQSLRKSASVTTSGEDLLDADQPPFLSYGRGRSGSVLSTRKLPPYAPGVRSSPRKVDEEAAFEMTPQQAMSPSLEQEQQQELQREQRQAQAQDMEHPAAARSSTGDNGAVFVVGHDDAEAAAGATVPTQTDEADGDVGGDLGANGSTRAAIQNRATSSDNTRTPSSPEMAHARTAKSGSANLEGQRMWHGRNNSLKDGPSVGEAESSNRAALAPPARQGFSSTVRNGFKSRGGNAVDLSGILIVTTEEQWSSK